MNELLINHEGVCRTAPATLGLLDIVETPRYFNRYTSQNIWQLKERTLA